MTHAIAVSLFALVSTTGGNTASALAVGDAVQSPSGIRAASAGDTTDLPPSVEILSDLTYREIDGHRLALDLYRPRSGSGPFPVILFVHGERPRGTNKTAYRRLAALVADRGFAAAAIQYRNVRETAYPGALDDLRSAVRWLRENATDLRLNPGLVGGVGDNFGGYLAALGGVTSDPSSTAGAPTLAAVAAMHAPLDLRTFSPPPSGYPTGFALYLRLPLPEAPERWAEASPISHVSPRSASFLLLHGGEDDRVPVEQSRRMAHRLRTAGVDAELWLEKRASNGFFTSPEAAVAVANRLAEFFHGTVWQPPPAIRWHRDVVYAKPDGRELRLDLFLPASGAAAKPGIILIHGGGWAWGDKTAHREHATLLADRGFAVACIEYRLSRERTYPAAVDDAKAAVRWMRAHASTYGIDPDRIGVAGSSAGGHIAALLGVTGDRTHFRDGEDHRGWSAEVQAVVAISGPVDMVAQDRRDRYSPALFMGSIPAEAPDRWAEASPMHHVNSRAAPFLFMGGTADGLVAHSEAVRMAEQLRAAGVRAEVFTAEDGGHDFHWEFRWRQTVAEAMADFFTRMLVGTGEH